MTNDTDIIALRQPESVDDPLTEIARDGARRMLAAALRAEADAFVEQYAEEVLPDGRQRVVRHGYGPERSIQTGIGALDVRRPKAPLWSDHHSNHRRQCRGERLSPRVALFRRFSVFSCGRAF